MAARDAASRLACAVVLLLVLAAASGLAQEMAVPTDLQFSLFYRILTYDRALERRASGGLVIGVVYQGRFRASALASEQALRQAPSAPAGFQVRLVPLDLDSIDLGQAVEASGCDVLYVTPLRAVGIRAVTAVSHAHGILTLTGVPAYVEAGLAVGIGLRGDRPEIVVNLDAVRAEGSDFSAQLLRLARVW